MNIVSDSVHSEQFDQLSTRSLRSLQSARKKFERCSPEPRTKLLQRQVSYPSKTYSSRVNIQRVIQQESMNMTPDTVWSFLGDMSWPEIALCAAALYALKKALSFALANCNLKLFEISDPPSNAYAGKVVWIVGASQGLGLALAEHFASQGAKLILSSRSVEKLEAVKLKCLKYIGENDVKILPVDITEEYAQVRQKTDMAFQEFEEGIDYIVHNAGASQHAAVEETSHDVAKALVDMNLLGEVSVARASLPHMLQRSKGHHIVIASMAACVPSPGQAMYSAAKSGLKSYFLSMSSEICARGVGVTVVCPGPIESGEDDNKTRMVYGKDGMMPQKSSKKSSKRVPVKVVASLVAKAAYHKLDECWISYHPVLFMAYLMRYTPGLAMKLLQRIGPKRVKQFTEGTGTGYDVKSMLK